MLTYSDLITLLLGLFVILYAMSKIDAGKYAEIAAALGGVFGSNAGKMSVAQGNRGVLQVPIPRCRGSIRRCRRRWKPPCSKI